MVKFKQNGRYTSMHEDGFTLMIGYENGMMYVQHPCPRSEVDIVNAPLLFEEVLDERCMDCGDVSLPDDLKGIWYLYNFDRIQRGGK